MSLSLNTDLTPVKFQGNQYVPVSATITNNQEYKTRELPSYKFYMGQPLNLNMPSFNRTISNEPIAIVIDDFTGHSPSDIDNDQVIDEVLHGEITSSFIKEGKVEKMDSNSQEDDVYNKLKNIRQRAENGENIGVISISMSMPFEYSEFSEYFGSEITPQNVKEKAPQFIKMMRSKIENNELSPEDMKKFGYVVGIYDEIEALAKLEVPVVTSAGNKRMELANYCDLYAINENAIVVGATEKNSPIIAKPSINNSLVDIKVPGVFNAKDLPAELLLKCSTIKNYLKTHPGSTLDEALEHIDFEFGGTSFSTPLLANEILSMKKKGIKLAEIQSSLAIVDSIRSDAAKLKLGAA